MLKITSHPPPPPTHTRTHSLLDATITIDAFKYIPFILHATVIYCILSCYNNEKRYYVTSGIEKNVDRLIEDLDRAFAKYRGAYHIGSKSKTSEARKRKEQRKKSKNRRLNASNNRRKRACIIFRSVGGEPVELCYEPEMY